VDAYCAKVRIAHGKREKTLGVQPWYTERERGEVGRGWGFWLRKGFWKEGGKTGSPMGEEVAAKKKTAASKRIEGKGFVRMGGGETKKLQMGDLRELEMRGS